MRLAPCQILWPGAYPGDGLIASPCAGDGFPGIPRAECRKSSAIVRWRACRNHSAAINRRSLSTMRHGRPMETQQVHACVSNYPDMAESPMHQAREDWRTGYYGSIQSLADQGIV